MKRVVLVALAIVLLAAALPWLRPAAERAWFVSQLAAEDVPARLPNPVQIPDARPVADTWGAPRAGGRRHEGIDIFAPKGTPVRSTTRGIVTRVGSNRLGGRVVGVLGPGLEWHYYAHLDRFADVSQGDLIDAGEVLGYVGNSGNARGTPPHLHYGTYRSGPRNPYPRLAPPLAQPAD